jgi:flagellar biosynthetic protein FliR
MVNRTLPSPELLSVSLALAGEVFMGLMIGFGVRALFSAVAIGAELSGLQMGFGVVTLYNPLSGQADSVTARLVGMMAIILFFAMNAHHLLIQVLVLSFARVPFSGVTLSAGLFSHLVVLSGNMFYFGMKIAVPVMISLLLANGSLGLLSRLVPQVNIFMTSFAVTIGLGLIVLGASLSIVAALIQDQISGLDRTLIQLTRELGGG